MDSAIEEVEAEGEELQEVVALLEEAAVEVQEEEASPVRKEARRPSSYVYKLSPTSKELRGHTGTTQASRGLRSSCERRHAGDEEPYTGRVGLWREENLSGI